jgi:hypothetical protein
MAFENNILRRTFESKRENAIGRIKLYTEELLICSWQYCQGSVTDVGTFYDLAYNCTIMYLFIVLGNMSGIIYILSRF